MPYEEFDVSNG